MRGNGSWGYQKPDLGKGATEKEEKPPDSGDTTRPIMHTWHEWRKPEQLDPGSHQVSIFITQANRPGINKRGAGKLFSAQTWPSFCLAPMSAAYLLVNQQSLAEIVLCAKHLGGQLVLERSVRNGVFYLYLSSFWSIATQMPVDQLSLKISPRYDGKRWLALNLLQASRPRENRTRPRVVWVVSDSHIWQKRVSVCVPWALWKHRVWRFKACIPEMTILLRKEQNEPSLQYCNVFLFWET